MRILVVASTFPRWPDDTIPPFVYHLSVALSKRGHRVFVLAPHAVGAATMEDREGLRIYRFRYAPGRLESLAYGAGILANLHSDHKRWALVPPFVVSQWASLVRVVRRHNIDVVHAHWMVPQGLVTAAASPLMRRPVVVTGHGSDVFEMRRGIRLKMLRFAADRATLCTTVSRALHDALRELTGVDSLVIPMGVDTSLFEARRPRSGKQIRSSPHILFVGRLVDQKGVEHLLEAVSLLRSRYPGARLEVIGDGPQRRSLENMARGLGVAGQVAFRGAIANSDMPAQYGKADLFVLPSVRHQDGDTEGLSVALLEAASSGLPVVASGIGGITDVIEHGQSGLLVEPADPAAIASALDELLRDDNLRRSIARAARQKVTERYSWDSVAQRLETAYESVVPPNSSAAQISDP
jgi:glycosyltransferase involved in cell wall biosynthesis